ncbi:MAG: ATP-dependent Clp protease ATP-binding subunit [Spirochaetales bacterium]|nr:ATP-dependent Clp protease ATP-binding subunit [Spirochaetales bacterium]
MSTTTTISTKIGNRIVDVECLRLTPQEINLFLTPKLESDHFTSKEDYMEKVSLWLIPELAEAELQKEDYKSLYYSLLRLHPTMEYERLEFWKSRGFEPDYCVEFQEQRTNTFAPRPTTAKQFQQQRGRAANIAGKLRETNIEELKLKVKEDVMGQDKAIDAIFDWLYLIAGGATSDRANLFCGYLMGPSGVGKTSFVESLSAHSGINFKQFSGSEYQEAYDAKRFLGSAPGLVGYDEEGGPLQKFVARYPDGIILFDEADKMHPSIWTALTNFLDKGVIQDGKGKDLYFNGLIFFTSNIGYNFFDTQMSIGFDKENKAELEEKRLKKLIEKQLPFEIIGRINDFFQFEKLSKEDLNMILAQTISKKNNALVSGKISLCHSACNYIIDKAFDPKTGARNLHHVYEKEILLPFIKTSLSSDKEKSVFVTYEEEQLVFEDVTA